MTKLTIIIATAVALLATALSPVHAQEQYALGLQTTIVNDDPVLRDQVDPYTWWKPPANIDRLGYGSNGFHFTVAIGNDGDDQLDDLAIWEFDSVDGRYEVQAWIPAEWATAHVQYLIWADENGDSTFANEYVAGPWLDQQTNNGGWQSLGVHTLHGRVRIELRDTRARDDYRDVGTENARIAADAIRLLRNGQTSSEEPPTPPRSVMAVPHGESSLRVMWSAPTSSGSSPTSGYELEYSRDALRNHPVYGDRGPYNSGPVSVNGRSHTTGAFLRGITYTVKVVAINGDGQRSEPAITTATTGASTAGAPTQVRRVSAVPHGTRQIRVTWSPPSDSGSAAIRHYIVRYWRPAIGDSPAWSSSDTTTSTSHTSRNLRYGTTYTVTVTAVNRDDRAGSAAGATQETGTTAPPTQVRRVSAVAHGTRQIRVTWSPPSDSGSAVIRHYIVRYWRPAIGDSPAWSSSDTTTSTSHTSGNLRYGTTYTVTVTAVNLHGSGPEGRDSITTLTVQMAELEKRLTESVKNLEELAFNASISARDAADAALYLERLVQEDESTNFRKNTKNAEKNAQWASNNARDARSLHEEIDNDLSLLWEVTTAGYSDFIMRMEGVESQADKALQLTVAMSEWASWAKLTAALLCTAIQDRLVKEIYDDVSLGLTVLGLAGSVKNLVVKGLRALGEVALDHLMDEAEDRIVGKILDEILPEDVREVIGIVYFLDPPEPPTSGEGIAVGCDYKDGQLYRLPLCNDLSWWQKNVLGTICRK